jgi:hypothetical protein
MNDRVDCHRCNTKLSPECAHGDATSRVRCPNLARLLRRQSGDRRSILPRPSIDGLRRPVSPAAVTRFVVAVVVDSVDGVITGRTLAHVGQENLEVIPAMANLNATVCVPRLSLTPSSHAAPRLVSQARRAAAIVPMRGQHRLVAFDRPIGGKAPATLYPTGSQQGRRNHRMCTTHAAAFDCPGTAIDTSSLAQHRESTPLATIRHRYVFRHAEAYQ